MTGKHYIESRKWGKQIYQKTSELAAYFVCLSRSVSSYYRPHAMMELFGISNRSIVDRIISNPPWYGQRTPPGPYWWTGKIVAEEETINDGTWSGWVSSAMIRCANSGGWAEWMSLPKLRCGGGWQRDRYIKEEHKHTFTTPPLFILLVDWQEMWPPPKERVCTTPPPSSS